MMPPWCRQVNWGNCGIPWVNCAVLCVKDDWKRQFWGLPYCLSKLRSSFSFSVRYDVTQKNRSIELRAQRALNEQESRPTFTYFSTTVECGYISLGSLLIYKFPVTLGSEETVYDLHIISVNLGNVLQNKVLKRERDEKPKSAVPHEERNCGIGVQFAIWIFGSRFFSSTRWY